MQNGRPAKTCRLAFSCLPQSNTYFPENMGWLTGKPLVCIHNIKKVAIYTFWSWGFLRVCKEDITYHKDWMFIKSYCHCWIDTHVLNLTNRPFPQKMYSEIKLQKTERNCCAKPFLFTTSSAAPWGCFQGACFVWPLETLMCIAYECKIATVYVYLEFRKPWRYGSFTRHSLQAVTLLVVNVPVHYNKYIQLQTLLLFTGSFISERWRNCHHWTVWG